ncbi:MAG: HAD hydrolase-like protein [Clostridia bacterium]|nr:HAD hydrolase-like protein [Clostridia bacterium]
MNKEKIEYVLFDFFDTLLHRSIGKAQINAHLAAKVCRELEIPEDKEQALFRIRTESEVFAESVFGGAYGYRQITDEMLRRMKYAGLIEKDTDADRFYDTMLAMERSVEMTYLYPDTQMQTLLRYLTEHDVRIAIVSDYYLGSDTLALYLEHVGITAPFSYILVSCDKHETKASGGLYECALQDLQVSAAQCLMIGDNLYSDVQRAKEKGLHAIHVAWHDKTKQSVMQPVISDKPYQLSMPTDPRGLEAYAIALYTFCDKLYLALKRDGHDRVWFLSREGQALRAYFDLYLETKQLGDISTAYLYVSRLSTYLPSLAPAPTERFALFYKKPLSRLLECLQMPKDVSAQILEKLGKDRVLKEHDMHLLWENELFLRTYEHARMQQKEAFSRYLADAGLLDCPCRVAICDVGWSGTMQDHIHAVLGKQTQVYGYYLGLTGRTLRSDQENSSKCGLLFDAYELDRSLYGYWSFDHTFFERLLCADHGATDRYQITDGVAQPVLHEYESERGMHAMMLPVHEKIKEHFKALCCSTEIGHAQTNEHAFADRYLRAIAKLNANEMKLQRQLLLCQYENFIIMRAGKDHAGRRLTLANAWAQRGKYLNRALITQPQNLLTASRVLINERLYFPAGLARRRAVRLILRGRAK